MLSGPVICNAPLSHRQQMCHFFRSANRNSVGLYPSGYITLDLGSQKAVDLRVYISPLERLALSQATTTQPCHESQGDKSQCPVRTPHWWPLSGELFGPGEHAVRDGKQSTVGSGSTHAAPLLLVRLTRHRRSWRLRKLEIVSLRGTVISRCNVI